MGSKLLDTFLILAVFFIFQCNEVNSRKSDTKIIDGPPTINPNASEPVLKAGYIVQKLTTKIHYVGQVLFSNLTDQLYSLDRKVNGSVYIWNKKTGLETRMYIQPLSRETLTTMMPIELQPTKAIFGSNRSLRYYNEISDTDYFLSEPIVRFDDPGFIIYSSHCDSNGIMFTLLIGETEITKNLGKLYKVENDTATLVRDFTSTPRDFRFDENDTSLYIVHDNGRKIQKIQYNSNTSVFGSATDVFDKDKHPEVKGSVLRSLVPDKNGHLWVAAAGKEGLVLEINPSNGTLVSKTPVPSKDLTFITFGLDGSRTLFVGSKATCTEGVAQGATYTISGMGAKGVPDYRFKYKSYNWVRPTRS